MHLKLPDVVETLEKTKLKRNVYSCIMLTPCGYAIKKLKGPVKHKTSN